MSPFLIRLQIRPGLAEFEATFPPGEGIAPTVQKQPHKLKFESLRPKKAAAKAAALYIAWKGDQATSHLCFFTLYRGMKGTKMGTVVTYFWYSGSLP